MNLWLGFPYMFLVCMGALQAIPEDISEAATVDGANAWQIFRRIKFPLLLVTVTPLLIASFAFNFNNFNLIYMLTNGGPRFADVSIPVGHTDILISMVYKVAFTGSGPRLRSGVGLHDPHLHRRRRPSRSSASARPRRSRS